MALEMHVFKEPILVELGMVVSELDICWLLHERMKKTADAFSDVGRCPLEMHLFHVFWVFNCN